MELTRDSIVLDFALRAEQMRLSEVVVTTAAPASGEERDGAAQAKAVGDATAREQARRSQVSVAPPPAATLAGISGIQGRVAAGYAGPGAPLPDYRRRGEPHNTEGYAPVDEQPFLSVSANPLSTFGIDVDRASYGNVRRFITSGRRPPRDAVRIEEMVNYFPYALPAPRGEHPFSVTTEAAAAPWQPAHQVVRIGLQGRRIDLRTAPANNLVFLLDVSGSMRSPDKLPLVQASMRLLVNELREEDRVAIVVYAGAAGLVLPSTPGSDKARILAAIDALEAGGSTAGGAGIQLAYDVAREQHLRHGNNRVVLATDGDFNVGTSSDAELVRLIEQRREQGTFLTVLGFGTGNLKDSKLELLADRGNGNYAYVDDLAEARKVLVTEMGGTLVTIAKDVKLQVEFNPARVAAYRLIGYENRALRAEDFADDRKDAGELGAGHAVTALYEIIPVGVASPVEVRGVDELRYQRPANDAGRDAGARPSGELGWVKLRYKTPTGSTSRLLEQPIVAGRGRPSADFVFATAVAEFGLLLRESEFRGASSVESVLARARSARGEDEGGYRREFVELVERYRGLEAVVER